MAQDTFLFAAGSQAATLLIIFISVYQWLAPMVAVAIAIGSGVLISGLSAALLSDTRRASVFVKSLLVWVVLTAPTAAWMYAPVRALAVANVGAKLPAPAQAAALRDPAPEVRLGACVALGVDNKGTTAREIMAQFYHTPNMSARCVQEVAQQDPEGAARLASAYVGEWHASLRTQDDAAICRGTPQVLAMSGYSPTQPALELTECAATYSTDEVSGCCADALAAHYSDPITYVEALQTPDSLPVARRASLFTALVPYAFVDLAADRRPLPAFEANLMNTTPGQIWVLALGCGGLLSGGGEAYVEGFEAIVSQQSCGAPVSDGPRVNTWKNICAAWYQQPERGADLCPAVAADAKQQAILTASARVHDAIRALYASETGRNIVDFGAQLERYNLSDEARSDRYSQAFGRTARNFQVDPRLRRVAREIHGNQGARLRELQDAAAEISKKPVDRSETERNLLDRGAFQPEASWQEIKGYIPTETRKGFQEQIDRHRDALKK